MRRFLILGCGSIGRRHLGNLLAARAGEILAFDPNPARAEEIRTRFGVPALTDPDEAFAHRPDVVFITAPTSLHVPLALRAAGQGCHLFIEKPLAHTREGVDRLRAMVRRQHLVTLVGCNLRFHPALRTVRRLLAEQAVGRVVAARLEVGQYLPDWHPWEDYRTSYSARRDLGGGVLLDAIHEIDYARWLFGEVRTVACFAGRLSSLQIDTEDTVALLVRFASGTLGEIHLDYVQRAASRTCHVIGEEGTIRADLVANEVRLYTAATRAWQTLPSPAGWQVNAMYADELAHFLHCLDGRETPEQDVHEAARVLDVALAAKESAASGRVLDLHDAGVEA